MASLAHLHETREGVSVCAMMLPSQNMKFPFGFIIDRKRKDENRSRAILMLKGQQLPQ